jgi:uncharacterized protein YbjT (DUF2867 family)
MLAGATGLVGREILKALLAADVHRVDALVRRSGALGAHPQVREHVSDLKSDAAPQTLQEMDAVLIALGTTIKTAGSQAAFKAVDFDAVRRVARWAKERGAKRIGVVSAMGASASSGVFYNRVKGEMEDAITALGFERTVIVRPSFLAGDRESLNQMSRPGERLALAAMRVFNPLIPANYKAVSAQDVANSLVRAVWAEDSGRALLLSGELQI